MNKLLTYIQGTFANSQTAEMMEAHPSGLFTVTKTISAADVVVWTGGEDIDPVIYGSRLIPGTYINRARDMDDLWAIRLAEKKIKIGICRGAQLLNCEPNGGIMWQDVDGHELGFSQEHDCQDYITGSKVRLNSVHHQMMRPTSKGLVICGTSRAKEKYTYEEQWSSLTSPEKDIHRVDPEAIWYEDTKSLCFQPHPEFLGSSPSTTEYFWDLVTRYIINGEGKAV